MEGVMSELQDGGYKRVVVELPAYLKKWLEEIVEYQRIATIKEYLIGTIQRDYALMQKEQHKVEEERAADQSQY